jgi:hypothetical protein
VDVREEEKDNKEVLIFAIFATHRCKLSAFRSPFPAEDPYGLHTCNFEDIKSSQRQQNISTLCSIFGKAPGSRCGCEEKRRGEQRSIYIAHTTIHRRVSSLFSGFKARGRIIGRHHRRFWRNAIFPAPAKHDLVFAGF